MARRRTARTVDVTPSASRLTNSLRDVGYEFASAVADVVDNSLSAGAGRIDVLVEFDGADSRVIIADDGTGMTTSELNEALRFGSRRQYDTGDLGRYGLGLKTASLSQCRQLTVVTRHAQKYRRLSALTLDLDRVLTTDRWEVIEPDDATVARAGEWLDGSRGTVVIWDGLDRVIPMQRPDTGWARRRLENLADKTAAHLGMVFHRFLEGPDGEPCVTIAVNGQKIRPWNPFAPDEPGRKSLPEHRFEVATANGTGFVWLRPFVLPAREQFSHASEFDRLSGPRKWNRQQGLYIYRAGRMIQSGGWCGLRAADEHTKLARAAVEFGTELDDAFRINVSKMRVSMPVELRAVIERPVQELCITAQSVYRHAQRGGAAEPRAEELHTEEPARTPVANVGAHLVSAAIEAGEHHALERIIEVLKRRSPDAAAALGW